MPAKHSYRFIVGTQTFLPTDITLLREYLDANDEAALSQVCLAAGTFFRMVLPAEDARLFFGTLTADDDPVREFVHFVMS